MQLEGKEEIRRFIRFCIVGLMNTAVTFLVFTVMRHLGCGLYLSNVLSYVAGVINSFIWNKNWVYRSEGRRWYVEALLFVCFFGICYSIQLVVFKLALLYLPEWLSQILGMGTYSVTNFILNRLFTFRSSK